tara:strand:+ start:33960 stop:35348 length:1389 start_codon:yes stop_codon:yes gene_type:complete
MQLLEDVFIVENLQILTEGKDGPMRIRGCFQRADEENNNKRVYGKPLLEREITKLAEAITERRLMGELDHPQHDSVKLSNVSHLITGLSMKGNEVIGEAEILDTPSGKVAQALIRGGVKVGVSSRGMGTVSEDVHGQRHVNEDFRLITWDLVADPSTRGAYPGLTESTQIQEIIDKVLPEAHKVKNFTTLLKESLNEAKSSDTLHREGASTKAVERRKTREEERARAIERKALKSKRKDDSTSLADLVRNRLEEKRSKRQQAFDKTFRRTGGDVDRAKEAGEYGSDDPNRTPGERRIKDINRSERAGRVQASTSLADLVRSKLYEEGPKKHQNKPLPTETAAPRPKGMGSLTPDEPTEVARKPARAGYVPPTERIVGRSGREGARRGKARLIKRLRAIGQPRMARSVKPSSRVLVGQDIKRTRIMAARPAPKAGKRDTRGETYTHPLPTDTQMQAAKRKRGR